MTRLRAAAGPHTKLLIGDMLLPNACADEAAYDGADGSAVTFPFVTKDSPLLPNLGVANIHGYLIDVMVGSFAFVQSEKRREVLTHGLVTLV